MNTEHQKTDEILKWFNAMNQIPRCSKNEAAVCKWLMKWAKDNGFQAEQDKVGNVLIKVHGAGGGENAAPVIIQGHVDMVCEKNPESTHNFCKDPIKLVYKDEWLCADGTTLGADNGIAVAMGMTAALDDSLKRPPLELLFTIDEEKGMTGALNLEPGFVKGKMLLNIDSETEGVFTVGCAGGMTGAHYIPLEWEALPDDYVCFSLKVDGLSGGHSADIHHEKANALKLIARTLDAFHMEVDFHILDLLGGSADNAIARSASAVIAVPNSPEAVAALDTLCREMETVFKSEFKNTDPDLSLLIAKVTNKQYKEMVTVSSTETAVLVLLGIPHGIYAMSTDVENFVETSDNLANMKIKDQHLVLRTLQRSPSNTRLDDVTARINAVVALAGGSSVNSDRYPGWPADKNSKLLERCIFIHKKLYGNEPLVETTHGGLECGVIGDKFPGIDMISFGPTIRHPHSPDETIHVPSIGKIWDFLVALLDDLTG